MARAIETPFRAALCLLLLRLAGCSYSMDDLDFGDDEEGLELTSMLQVSMELTASKGKRDLVLAYIPYNFGHTVAAQAAAVGTMWGDCGDRAGTAETCMGYALSEATGCPLMYTPAKLWPPELAESHFGQNRTVFGILRDPYERMVAQFRGSGWSKHPDLYATCDVNEGVKRTMRQYKADVEAGRPFVQSCMMLPQAEFFDGPLGASVVVDNRKFPASANELLAEHGYDDVQLKSEEIEHVSGCDHVWAGDLDAEARGLVREVYRRDFELLCDRLGYCNQEESTCLEQVPGMCPPQLFQWDQSKQRFFRRQ